VSQRSPHDPATANAATVAAEFRAKYGRRAYERARQSADRTKNLPLADFYRRVAAELLRLRRGPR
jgi:hypothetical protein